MEEEVVVAVEGCGVGQPRWEVVVSRFALRMV